MSNNKHYQSRIDFPLDDNDKDENTLKQQQIFDEDDTFISQDELVLQSLEHQQHEQDMQEILAVRPSLLTKCFWFALCLLLLSLLGHWVWQFYLSWISRSWISILAHLGGILLVIIALVVFAQEIISVIKFKQVAASRQQAESLRHQENAAEQAIAFCEALIRKSLINEQHASVVEWRAMIEEHHTSAEVLLLYAKLVQPILDKQVKKQINYFAAEATIMVAISPFALVDAFFVAWRNFRLINKIARLYGINLGYISRLKLLRLVLVNVAFAGVSELIQEVGMDWLSQDLTAKLSARAAQGFGVGILTVRLGIKAMELCRPIPWIADDKPQLNAFKMTLLAQLKETVLAQKRKAS